MDKIRIGKGKSVVLCEFYTTEKETLSIIGIEFIIMQNIQY